jgi:putative phosphoesterase
MQVAAIYDIHGNLPALDAVLEDICRARVQRIVIGGDIVPGPMPQECLEKLLDVDVPVEFIHGNGDREVIAQMRGVETEWYRKAPAQWREPVRWTAQQLKPEMATLLAAWPKTLRMKLEKIGEVLFCHATPRNDTEIFTQLTSEEKLLPVFAEVDERLVICGHTHMQFDRMVGKIRVVNAGSVGMPFGEPGAYWLLLGPGLELRRTAYDLTRAAKRIQATTYPQAQEFAEQNVLHPPSEEKMLEVFGRAELK